MRTISSQEIFTKKFRQQQNLDSDRKEAWHYNHLTFTPIAKNFMLYCRLIYRVFSLTWPASMQIYWNKRKRLHKKRVQLPQDWFGTPTWPPFHCFHMLSMLYVSLTIKVKVGIPESRMVPSQKKWSSHLNTSTR